MEAHLEMCLYVFGISQDTRYYPIVLHVKSSLRSPYTEHHFDFNTSEALNLGLCDECTSSDFLSQHPESISSCLPTMAKPGLHVIDTAPPTMRAWDCSKKDCLRLPFGHEYILELRTQLGKSLHYNISHVIIAL